MTEAEEDRMDRLEEALHRVASWAEAYPLSVFPEPDAEYYRRAREALEEHGMTLDRIAAASMRHVVTQIAHIARTALEGAGEAEIGQLKSIVRAILEADERGQGVLYAEAMDAARKAVT